MDHVTHMRPTDPWPIDPWPTDTWPIDTWPIDPWPTDPWPIKRDHVNQISISNNSNNCSYYSYEIMWLYCMLSLVTVKRVGLARRLLPILRPTADTAIVGL